MTGKPGTFRLGDLLSEARGLLKGTKTTMFLIMLLAVGINMVISFGLTASAFFSPDGTVDSGNLLIVSIINAFVSSLIAPGVAAVGLHRAAHRPVSFGLLAEYMKFFPWFLVLSLAGYAIEFYWPFGDALVSLAMLIFSIFSLLAGFFIIDAGQNLLEAIGSSFAVVGANLGQVLLFMLLTVGLGIVGALTLGIALIWFLPLLQIILGLMYRESAGIRSLDGPPELTGPAPQP